MNTLLHSIKSTLAPLKNYPGVRYWRRSLPRNMVICSSFPKSGRTAFRFTWWVLSALIDGNEPVISWDRMNRYMPELPFNPGRGGECRDWSSSLPLLASTHRSFRLPFLGMPSVVIIRDPVKCMLSYHRFLTSRKRNRFVGSRLDFLDDPQVGIAAWIEHTRQWSRTPCVLRFESLVSDPAGEIGKALESLGLDVPAAVVESAVAISMNPEQVAIAERDSHIGTSFDKSFKFARLGHSVGADASDESEDLEFRDRIAKSVQRAGLGRSLSNTG